MSGDQSHSHGPDGHTHEHPHYPAASGPGETVPEGGPVVVDIGGDIGALIVRMDDHLLGEELHLRPGDGSWVTHTGIWRRQLGATSVTVAVFPELPEGRYSLLDADGEPVREVDVTGGSVTETDLRTEVASTR